MEIRLSENLKKAIKYAGEAAMRYANPAIGTEHLLYGLAKNENSAVGKILSEFGVKAKAFDSIFAMQEHVAIMGQPDFTARLKTLLIQAYRHALTDGIPYANCEYALLGILSDPTGYAYTILRELFKSDIKAMYAAVSNALSGKEGQGRPMDSALPKELEDLGVDLTRKAKEHKIDPVIGRKEEIERIIQILCRKTKNNPVLIGEPGVGKSAVAEGLAKQIVEGSVPEQLKNKILFSLDMASIIAGTKYRGAMEEKLKNAISLIRSQNNIILFIDELHTLAQAGGKEGEVSCADILKPYLARGELQTIGATTTDEYKKFIETDKALERRFQPITIDPPGVDDTIEILKGLKENYEAFHKITLTDEAIRAAAVLSDRYIMDRFLPDKAIDLIDEAMSRAKVSGSTVPPGLTELERRLIAVEKQKEEAILREDYKKAIELREAKEGLTKEIESLKLQWSRGNENNRAITGEDIAEIVAKWTKIPVKKLSESETERLNNLESILHKRVIGQDKAITSVSRAIRRARAGLKDPSRPIGTFMFLGPTGVGKTELTKALSEAVFDDENAVIRIDMSEYMEAHSVSKLIGSPPGYVGFDDGGQLTEQVRRKPYSVVLFDEIEKAHPDVTNILLQMLDEGRLTDSRGRTVSFKNTVIIMTSNAGVSELKSSRSLGFTADETAAAKNAEEILLSALKRRFKPEFLNRIDVICIFESLSKDNLAQIATIMLKKLSKSLSEKNIKSEFTPALIDYVINKGYDVEYGARPLKRVIQQQIEDTVAEKYLSGQIKDGCTLIIDYNNGVRVTSY